MKNQKAGASLGSKCLAILHCLVFTLFAQPADAKRPISKPSSTPAYTKPPSAPAYTRGPISKPPSAPAYAKPPISKPSSAKDEFLKPLGLDGRPLEGLGRPVWIEDVRREAQDRIAQQPRLTPKNIEEYKARDPSIINIDRKTWEMCQLQSNQRLRTCLAIERAIQLYRENYYVEEGLKKRNNDPWGSSWPVLLAAGGGAVGGILLAGPAGAGVGALAAGITAHQTRKEGYRALIHDVQKEREQVSKILRGLVRDGVYLESLCLSYNGVVKISEKGEMICYRKNTDSSKSANQFNLASLADAHGKVCQELYGKKAAPARYVLGNKIVCSVNNKYEVVKDYTLTDLINGCKMTGKKVGEAATKVCTDFIANMKKTKPNSTVIGQKTDATSPTEKADTKKTNATSPTATSTTGEQNIADQVAQIIGTDPAQKSQTGNPLSPKKTDPLFPERTTKSMKKLKHQMILEAIKQERESNKMMAENFEKLIKAKIEDARRDTEFHQKVHEFLLKKIEHDALEHQEKMIRHEQYIREQQEKIRSIQQLIHPGRFHSIKQQQHLGAQR
jgi:hypothetical protein